MIPQHTHVASCAVVGANDNFRGQVPIGFIVLKSGVITEKEKLIKDVVQSIRGEVGPIACFKQAAVVESLPKTRSGKILRGTIRKIADGKEYNMPSTIDDPAVLAEMEDAVKSIGYGKKKQGQN